MGSYGFRRYEHERDEKDVCELCWKNALPGGRPFPLIPEAGAVSFGRVVTGPFAKYARDFFYVVNELSSGELVGYLTGAEGGPVKTKEGELPWMLWRDRVAQQIAEDEFGEISSRLWIPAWRFVEGVKLLYTISLGPRAMQFLLHAKRSHEQEMPEMPPCPEFHFQVAKGHRGRGIGGKLIDYFLRQLTAKKFKEIGAQVTVCEGQTPLAHYARMTVRGAKLWRIYDRRETAMYTADEKRAWALGPVVENVTLVAEKKRLLAFVRSDC